jgi:hypothetical protein
MRRTLRHRPSPALGAAVALALLLLPACGDDDGGSQPAASDTGGDADTGGDGSTTAGDQTTAGGGPAGGGSATLTIGGETWTFDTVRCAVGEETQSDEWDFVLSAIQDGLQLSVDRGAETGQYGDSIELDDIEDFENPSVSWSAPAVDLTDPSYGYEPFVDVDG